MLLVLVKEGDNRTDFSWKKTASPTESYMNLLDATTHLESSVLLVANMAYCANAGWKKHSLT
jgi:hypothetical protein